MKIGVLGARADFRGLAYQTQSFCKWLQPTRVLGLDLTADNLSPYECDWSAYSSHDLTVFRHNYITEDDIRTFLRGLDVVLGAETFYKDSVVNIAREEGVRTVLQYNPEFAPWWIPKDPTPRPDVLIAPTVWRMDEQPGTYHLPFPVDRTMFPFTLRTSADRFTHVAGHKAAGDRAGTRIVLGAMPRMRTTPVTIRSQSPLGFSSPKLRNGVLEEGNLSDPRLLYEDTDVLLLPRRYGGLSLVHNEALSLGIPVISLDRNPENSWGGVSTISASVRTRLRTKSGSLPVYDVQSGFLVRAVETLKTSPEKVVELSHAANAHAASISWNHLLPIWQDVLHDVGQGDEPIRLLRR